MKKTLSPQASERGSVLIVALVLAGIIGISLASYIRLSTTTHNLSNRAFYNNAAMNLAEQGLEEAMYSINKNIEDDTFLWTSNGWTQTGGDMRQEWSGVTLSQGATASYRVYFHNYHLANAAPKTVVARARVQLAGTNSAPIEKWIQIVLRKTSKFANGLVAKDSVTFNGNGIIVDSWDSDPDNNPATPAIPYDTTTPGVRHANGSVASNNVISIGNADIFGFVATGGPAPSLGPNKIVSGDLNAAQGTYDVARVDTNFNTNLDPVYAPTGVTYNFYTGVIGAGVSLPRTTGPTIDSVQLTGEYAGYYLISADSINFNNGLLTITDKVILRLTSTGSAVDVGGGSGEIRINPNAELQIYTEGNVKIAGNGITNGGTTAGTMNMPVACQIWGTKQVGTQNIDIKGNGVLSAVVYAPQGNITISGDVYGSMVGKSVTLNGNTSRFHYDESLADFGVDSPYRVGSWKELTTQAERSNPLASVINW